ncbi:sigma-B regulation protein RsbU (phosphoserine phosphatase) [Azospirillum fermentarium]|uniref:fused response regulator/phosphatase n=1 Tax=Azospirillum fermentarium TaxID=1233114 RepID=UPI00222601B4|nr:fused response regulator/phosphatase [Azospirillum fermentarium]MCW2245831.1 sigma-B regulation protein RsbU (phosphoserine phosphatase) [Azospirillum fermentarium]
MSDTLSSLADSLILVVDDEAVNRLVIENLLRQGGFSSVVSVDSGEAALDFITRAQPACILLDVVMAGIDGLEVCRRLRTDPRFAYTPIIIQTVMSKPEDRRAAFAAGASDVVAKPYDPAELEARVRVHLSNALSSGGLMAYRAHMEAELAEARLLSEAVLPHPTTLERMAERGVRLDAYYHPCSAIGGDYWNCWTAGPDQIALMVGDVSGHGVSAALRMFAFHTLLTPPPPFSADLDATAAHLDRRLYAFGREKGQYVAGVYGLFDTARRVFRFIGGGLRHGFILHGQRSGPPRLDSVSLSGVPFGMTPHMPRDTREIVLGTDDTLIVYSDALVECDPGGPGDVSAPRDEEELAAWIETALPAGFVGESLAGWLGQRFFDRFGPRINDDMLIVTASLTG